MTADTYDYGPIQTYEVQWRSGHIEMIQAHQVAWPVEPLYGESVVVGTDRTPRVHFYGLVNGKWQLVLTADEADIKTVRLVTGGEPIPLNDAAGES